MQINLVVLGEGREIRGEVERHYDGGTVDVDGHTITVERLARPYEFLGYGELVRIKLKSGKTWGAVLQLQEYQQHVATVNIGESELELTRVHHPGDVITSSKSTLIMGVYDQTTKQWREMTEEEEQYHPGFLYNTPHHPKKNCLFFPPTTP